MSLENITLRKFPYPYRAALTICSDIDGTTFEDFIAIHDFLNSDKHSPMGMGLKLELADSFWFFSNPDTPDHALTYFQAGGQKESLYAPMIRDMIKAGYIDTLHSFGNFSVKGGFSREIAERSLEALDEHNLDLRVWVNHGDEKNLQNIGSAAHHLGDKPDVGSDRAHQPNPNYHTDLLVDSGFSYFWDSETSLTKIVGQDRECSLLETMSDNFLVRTPADKLRNIVSEVQRFGKRFVDRRRNAGGQPAGYRKNALLHPARLADGRLMMRFTRYGSGRYDWSEDLAFLIRDEFLDYLEYVEGASIVYNHWGDRKVRSGSNPFTQATIDAFSGLARRFREGNLWVTTTRKLLDFSFLMHHLAWRVERREGGVVIHIEGFRNNPLPQKKLHTSDLSGLAFYTNEPDRTEVRFSGLALKTVATAKDFSGRASISIPLTPMEYPGPLRRSGSSD